jgi:hypothetical protein
LVRMIHIHGLMVHSRSMKYMEMVHGSLHR